MPRSALAESEMCSMQTSSIYWLRDEPGLARRLIEAAHELARVRYSWDAVGDALALEYGRRFGRGRGPG